MSNLSKISRVIKASPLINNIVIIPIATISYLMAVIIKGVNQKNLLII